MSRWVISIAVVVSFWILAGCSGSGQSPVTPDNGQAFTPVESTGQETTQNWLLNFYDIYFDIESETFEAVENRTANLTLNIVPFLNQMISPPNGITFDQIVLHQDDPGILGVDVVFTIYHPFPGYDQYDAYDVRGILIGDGSDTLAYEGLKVAEQGVDLWMINPDGYSRWFNPTEFTTELIFGYAPGGWQNYAGDATINPYKYYPKGIEDDEDVWDFLTGDNHNDAIFESGTGRFMELEFVLPPDGIGISFGYAVAVSWEEQGPTGPYVPMHIGEPAAVSVSNLSDAWYNEIDGSGGNLILDIDVFAWDEQPSIVKIESSVLDTIAEFDFDTYASPGGENYSTWHIESPVGTLDSAEGHYYWVIAECGALDYSNGLPDIPHADGPLAAFFKYGLTIGGETPNEPPICDLQLDPSTPFDTIDLSPVVITFDATGSYDPDAGDVLTYEWDFNGDGTYDGPEDTYFGAVENPTHWYLVDYTGKAYVRITDTYDDQAVCEVDLDITAIPSKNLPLRGGAIPDDIAWDPYNEALLILYADEQVWRRDYSALYQTGSKKFDKLWNMWEHPQRIEVNPQGYAACSGEPYISSWGSYAPQVFYYKPDADDQMDIEHLWSMQFVEPQPTQNYLGIVSMGTNGSYQNDCIGFYGYDRSGAHWVRGFKHFDTHFDFSGWVTYSFTGSDFFGPEKLYWEYLVSAEADLDGNHVWFLENTDYYCSRFEIMGSSIVYTNAYFGTGSQTNDDDGWYNAQDISRDDDNNLFVLDELSGGDVRIKMWTVSGDTTTSEGGFGDSTSIIGPPLRIEGTDFDGNIFVLHGDDTGGYFLSIFKDIEKP